MNNGVGLFDHVVIPVRLQLVITPLVISFLHIQKPTRAIVLPAHDDLGDIAQIRMGDIVRTSNRRQILGTVSPRKISSSYDLPPSLVQDHW